MARVRALPLDPSLEHLKHQAKDLLEALKQGDAKALRRFARCFDVEHTPLEAFRLTQVQLILAREQGFSSWQQLAGWITERRLPTEPADLVKLLAARTGWVRRAVELALTEAGRAGVNAAIAGLSDPDPRVRHGAAAFMDHHADKQCVTKLIDLAMNDPVSYVRGMALHALGCQRCKPEPLDVDLLPLLEHMAKTDERWKARRGAVWSLAQMVPAPRVKEILQYVLEHDPDPRVVEAALGGLRRKQPGPFHVKEAKLRALAAKKRAERQPVEAAEDAVA
ncbi:MAG TPA: HEAT repeat domain-containing protein [Chloroflexota bacterium]|nr:HEAT repeat domain-containing protein [Chloroflexota bacterium]